MSTKLRTVLRDGWNWLVADANGKRHWLHRQAKAGDLMRPGQRATHSREGPCGACPHPEHAHAHARNEQARGGFY